MQPLSERLSPERVLSFAVAQLARLPAGALEGVDFCLAGGAFRCLLDPDATSGDDWASAKQPRDLDVWPRTEEDEKLLVARLGAAAEPTDVQIEIWNTRITLMIRRPTDSVGPGLQSMPGPGEPLIVEVVHAYGRDLTATLALFDIALADVGVRFVDGRPVETFIHPLALTSLESSELLLLPGAADSPFMLATAERLLRYARELHWPRPEAQLAALLATFRAASSARRAELVENFGITTQDAAARAVVCELFGLDESAVCGPGPP